MASLAPLFMAYAREHIETEAAGNQVAKDGGEGPQMTAVEFSSPQRGSPDGVSVSDKHLPAGSSGVRLSRKEHSHFYLLCDDELRELASALQMISRRNPETVQQWYEFYIEHFGDERSLREEEFKALFGPASVCVESALFEADLERFTIEMTRLGALLVESGVPFEEAVASLYFFNKSIRSALGFSPCEMGRVAPILDKLSCVQTNLLVRAYFRSHRAASVERIAALQKEAATVPLNRRTHFHGLVGASAVMRELYVQIEEAATASRNVLIIGEYGTEAKPVARAIHDSGPRRDQPFVICDCAALPRDLIEPEVFGHGNGTSGVQCAESLGAYRAADGGTLLLSAITAMSGETQAKLLRTVREGAVYAVESVKESPVNVRLIGAIAEPPEKALFEGRLNRGLWNELKTSLLTVPPLRERSEDIALLADHFITLYNGRLGKEFVGIEERALEAMRSYSWPGNVCELARTIECIVACAQSNVIQFAELPPAIRNGWEPQVEPQQPGREESITYAQMERELIAHTLKLTGGNKLRAAEILRISRKKLYAKIKRFDLCSEDGA